MAKKNVYQSGYFPVSDGHELYFEAWGNKRGFPILFFHGGPGSGFVDRHKKIFSPRRDNVIFFDQRGANRSRPFCSLKANTTSKLIEDTNRIQNHFGFKKVLLVGGSWGSTLALAYAIRYPERVRGIVLRALFLGDKAAMDHYIRGGVRQHFPDSWERFLKIVPTRHHKNPLEYYFAKMQSKDKRTRRKYCFEWAYFEMSIMALALSEKDILKLLKDYSFESLSILEAHYMRKNCFMPANYILKNARKLRKIPMSLVHGRYDVICPPVQAWELKTYFPKMKLTFYCGGHSEPGPEDKRLRQEVALMAKRLRR